jgi:homocitrate synthase NifV
MSAPPERRTVTICDTTLRDGEQCPGTVFSAEDKLCLAKTIAALGVREIELGSPAMGDEETDDIRLLAGELKGVMTTVWCRALPEDLEMALECGVRGINISVPASETLLRTLGKKRACIIAAIEDIVPAAANFFKRVTVGLQDCARADIKALIELAAAALESGAAGVRLSDTTGLWNPQQVFHTVRKIVSDFPGCDTAFHAHNDLGMAVANTVAAVLAGAPRADVTLCGIGERAGNAPLEEVVMALKLTTGVETGISCPGLYPACQTLARITGKTYPAWKPVTGKGIFTCESGTHAAALLKDPESYLPFQPKTTGFPEGLAIAVGKHSGSASVQSALASRGIQISREEAAALLPEVRRAAREKKRGISPDELAGIHRARGTPSEQ